MIARTMFGSLVAISALLVSDAEGAGTQEEAALRAVPRQIAEAWNRGDGSALGAVYAEDGVLVAGHGVVTRGRDHIASYHEQLFATSLRGTRLTVEVTSVRLLNQSTAVVQTEGGILWRGQTSLAPGNRGIQSFVLVKENAGWRVVLFQNTRIQDSQQ